MDWLDSKLLVQRGIVKGRVNETKTIYSEEAMTIDSAMLDILKAWKQTTEFSSNEDWVFASPARLGRQPWSYDSALDALQRAAERAEIGKVGTHSMRHSYRSWLDAVGSKVTVQQKLMRHADIRTTMSYGSIVTDEMSQAASKVAALALHGK